MLKIQHLQKASELLKISTLAKLSGIAVGTLDGKVRNGRDLTTSESETLERALKENGITLHLPE